MKKITAIILGMMVLAVSCYMGNWNIEEEEKLKLPKPTNCDSKGNMEEEKVELPKPTNCDSKGNMEYAKGVITLGDSYNENFDDDSDYWYQILFFEMTDTYNEWRESLQDRYKSNKKLNGVRYPSLNEWPFKTVNYAYNKVTILVGTPDGYPVGVVEYYIEGISMTYWEATFDDTAHVYIKDDNISLRWRRNN